MSSLSRGFSTQDYIDSYSRTHFITEDDNHLEDEIEQPQELSFLSKAKLILNAVLNPKKDYKIGETGTLEQNAPAAFESSQKPEIKLSSLNSLRSRFQI
jgi:hypothetical protein